MNRLITVLLICLMSPCTGMSQVADEPGRDVVVKIHLIDISQIDTVTQSFTANMTLTLQWFDPELAHDGPDSISRSVDEVWHPRIQIINQQRVVSTLPRTVEIRPDGDVIQRQRYWGSFSQPLDLREFPFDTQDLQINLANVAFGSEQINLVPSQYSGISETLTMPDWSVTSWDFRVTQIPFDAATTHIDGMTFSLEVERDGVYFIFKVIMPLMLIVMMSWLVFWIDPKLVASQISLAVTAMLTMIAYRFVLQAMLPRLGFLTSLDYFVVGSTLMVFLSMVETIYTAHLFGQDRLELARKIDRTARWLAPLLYAAIAFETHYLRAWT